MADDKHAPAPPAHNAAMPWPTVRVGKHHTPAAVCIVPGIQAPDLTDGEGFLRCGVCDKREPIGPGVGTLFCGSFADENGPHAVSAELLRAGHQAIRGALVERMLRDVVSLQLDLVRLAAAIDEADHKVYLSLAQQVEGDTCLLAVRGQWLAGCITMVGGAEDPLWRHLRQQARETSTRGVRRSR